LLGCDLSRRDGIVDSLLMAFERGQQLVLDRISRSAALLECPGFRVVHRCLSIGNDLVLNNTDGVVIVPSVRGLIWRIRRITWRRVPLPVWCAALLGIY
jgi:hypothetical protein